MENKIKIAIDLSWIRHGIAGGTESYAFNLLSGFKSLNDPLFEYYVIITKNNLCLLDKFKSFFKTIVVNIDSEKRVFRVIWQNAFLGKRLKKSGIYVCIEPIYMKPIFGVGGIKFVTTIHDLQAIHYPQYFSKTRVKWMKYWWRQTVKKSDFIVVTSEFVKNDIIDKLKCNPDKMVLNYDPVTIDIDNVESKEWLENEMHLKSKGYYYIASSLLPHKNIITPLNALAILKKKASQKCLPLVITGAGERNKATLENAINDLGISDLVIIAPFLKEKERNALYKYSNLYFAPSLFEGFGMTPIEAMLFGTPVITTRETCSYEVTGGLANYVDNATSPEEWASIIEGDIKPVDDVKFKLLFSKYTVESVAAVFNKVIENNFKEYVYEKTK